MTLAELKHLAISDAASTDARRMMAGKYALKAIDQIEARDWEGATHYILQSIARQPESYAPALVLVERVRGGATVTAARAAASRANGRKGGRPLKAKKEGGAE